MKPEYDDEGKDRGIECSTPEVDLWRETSVRYLGYANEVGEAFRPIYPRVIFIIA